MLKQYIGTDRKDEGCDYLKQRNYDHYQDILDTQTKLLEEIRL